MKNWYIRNNDQHLGPYSIDELKLVGLYNDDFVWKEGLEHWTKAETIAELKDMVISFEHNWQSRSMFADPEIPNSAKKNLPQHTFLKKTLQRLSRLFASFYKKGEQRASTIF